MTLEPALAPQASLGRHDVDVAGMIRIGMSGWVYPPWRGVFYPPKLPHKRELSYAAERVTSIEINGSFYSLQYPSSYQTWHDQTPDDFVFSVKAPRFITHMKKLNDVDIALANFFASGVLGLRAKLGPFLWQLPPNLGYHPDKLAAFFALLPRSTQEAAWQGRRHEERLTGRVQLETDADRPLRHALEVRHKSFEVPGFLELLREHHIAVVVADTAGTWPAIREVTTDFVYARLHGDDELYVSGYTDAALDTWAAQLRTWAATGRDVYTYFDNDVKVRSPIDAMSLIAKLS